MSATAAGGGDEDFEQSYVALFVRAQRIARRILVDPAEAADVASETMVRAFSSWSRVRAYSMPWVTRVATNLALDAVRRRKPQDRSRTAPSPEDEVLDRLEVISALAHLSSRQRQALVLCYLVGLTEGETAAVMGLSPGTVKTHLRRGLQTLRRRSGADLEELNRVPLF